MVAEINRLVEKLESGAPSAADIRRLDALAKALEK